MKEEKVDVKKVSRSKPIKKVIQKRPKALNALVEKFQAFKKLINKKLVEMYNETKELLVNEI